MTKVSGLNSAPRGAPSSTSRPGRLSDELSRTIPLIIPTIHYIGGKIFEIVHQNPGKQILFMITACEMTLEMFGDWGNMVGIRGIGVRLDGRICNTMKAFELSERGIKPGLTVVLEPTKRRILGVLQHFREMIESERDKE